MLGKLMNATRQIMLVAAVVLCATPFSRAADETDIHTAARLGDLARVTQLLDADPQLANARTAADETPLHYAAATQRTALIELLLERGADVNAVDQLGQTPLHLVASSSDAKAVRAVIDADADVNARDGQGETPLHIAARRLSVTGVRALIAAGADVNARNKRGETPLQVLGRQARTPEQINELLGPLAKLLIASGAEPGSIDVDQILRLHEDKDDSPPRDDYRTWPEIEQLLADWAADYPDICELHDLGPSVLGRHIWALRITDDLELEEDEPEFKYVSTMHGDEWVGNEMCLFFIDLLLTNYGSDPRITNLINEIDIWIVPVMNPDGYVLNRRENYNGVDLNRDFPEGTQGDENTTVGRQPETAAVMEWSFGDSFTLSANFHTGALVVNYPFDNDGMGSVFSPTPDQDMFVWISEEYSQHNLPMWNSPYFYHGITNGAAWYSISGGMQDWNYRYMGDNDVTIELSNTKRPPYYQIPQFWDDNRESMLAYMETCLIGVRGIVTDADTGVPLAATVTVVGRDHEIYTDPDVGDYHRMLLPGTYELRFEAEGYDPLVVSNVIVNSGDATRLDVTFGTPPGDLNGDGCVDQSDLGILLADWGCAGGNCPGDCDDDGDTDQADLGILLAHWGEGCP
jgi:ankyrin repeat protein